MAKRSTNKIGLLPTMIASEKDMRGLLALIFVLVFAFFVISSIILGGLSLFFQLNGKVEDVKGFILTLSGIFSGPLGLVIGYYFRSEVERKFK